MEEIDYYRTQSGLPQGLAQEDYELSYFQQVSGLPVGLTIDDYKQKFFETETGYSNVVDGEYWYYAQETSTTNPQVSVEDLKKIFFDMQ